MSNFMIKKKTQTKTFNVIPTESNNNKRNNNFQFHTGHTHFTITKYFYSSLDETISYCLEFVFFFLSKEKLNRHTNQFFNMLNVVLFNSNQFNLIKFDVKFHLENVFRVYVLVRDKWWIQRKKQQRANTHSDEARERNASKQSHTTKSKQNNTN